MGGDLNRNNLRLELDNNPKINGLDKFVADLEREYFSVVSARNCTPNTEYNNLVIELNCPIMLLDLFRQLQCSGWGRAVCDPATTQLVSPLQKSLSELNTINHREIEIEEFTIFLNDCSIIIKRIYRHSIPEQCLNLFNALSEHLVYLTRNFKEIPYEIYIPVFEEDLLEYEAKIASIEQSRNSENDYFGYWGLYFDSQDDAVIYELPRKRIISGELYMLDH